jgi:hypothetical protein
VQQRGSQHEGQGKRWQNGLAGKVSMLPRQAVSATRRHAAGLRWLGLSRRGR